MQKEYTSLQDFKEYMAVTNIMNPDKITQHGKMLHHSSVYETTTLCEIFVISDEEKATYITVAFTVESGKLFDIQIQENGTMPKTSLSPKEIYDFVLNDYQANDVELNTEYFNFNVNANKHELMQIYADLMKTINGDTVVLLNENCEILLDDDENITVTGRPQHFDESPELNGLYNGNFADFLKSFNDIEKESHLFRLMDVETIKNSTLLVGTKLDFIF